MTEAPPLPTPPPAPVFRVGQEVIVLTRIYWVVNGEWIAINPGMRGRVEAWTKRPTRPAVRFRGLVHPECGHFPHATCKLGVTPLLDCYTLD